ncbi:hypothetical protein [Trinickia mobilis]|uniref:hypothetical protein n=1 Tax=Trinickia mobilis TaxID=2816356 RepID=UPI001A8FC180|nr:hypothetical protein [Trinickia mobilis]
MNAPRCMQKRPRKNDIDNFPRPRPRSELVECAARYELELARGASHLASTMSYATLEAAMVETVADFVKLHGDDDLPVFLELLSRRLSERKKPEAASAIRILKDSGRPPGADELRSLWSSVGMAMG